jgi:formylglycine-generating enzyme required for sulfatase activity
VKKIDAKLPAVCMSTGQWQVQLPTEAEWEKAAGWDATRANVDNQVGYPCAVGVFTAGAAACGALDMTGNVWEWTLSQYVDYPYKPDARNNPAGDARRVLRGGAWSNNARRARVSDRLNAHPANFGSGVGVRVVVAPVL